MSAWPTSVATVVAFLASGAGAQQLLETAATLGKNPDPVTLEFEVATAGNYRITLTDFGTAAGPLRMSRVDAGILRGSELVRAVNVTSASSAGVATATFAAAAGTHRLVFVGRPASAATVGSAGVRVDEPSSGAILLDTLQTFRVPPPPVASPADFELELDVPAGSYTLTMTDFALPQALAVLDAIAIRRSDGFSIPLTRTAPVALSAGAPDTFEVFVHAELAPGAARGIAGLSLQDAGGGVVRHEVLELGEWRYRYTFDVSAAATLSATLADLQFPAPLTALAAQIVRDGLAVGGRFAPAAATTFAAVPGVYTLYVSAQGGALPGSFGTDIRPVGGAPFFEHLQNVVPTAPASDISAIEAFFDIASAGDYTLTLTDFGTSGFFDAFSSLNLGLTRDNELLQSLTAPGSLTFAATPGRYGIAIVADPAGTAGEGLLGIRVRGGAADTIVYDRTEAIGADFLSVAIDAPSAQSVDVRLTDLAFPAAFAGIRVAVTRGAERVGEIVGAGQFSFQATPGTYFVNLLATPAGAVGYGTFGLRAATTPAAPAVSLTASAASVTVGSSVTLTWTAQNADSCSASGGWSGSRATAGTASSGSLQLNTTFTLTCIGAGGSRDSSVDVAVTAAQRSGGGGGTDAWLLLLLAGAAIVERHRRQAREPAGSS